MFVIFLNQLIIEKAAAVNDNYIKNVINCKKDV